MQSKVRGAKLIPKEKDIEASILKYLEFLPGCFAWKNPTSGYYDARKGIFRKQVSKYAINGVADIIGVLNGRFLAIEVKTPENKLRPAHQERFLEQINKKGGIAFFATSLEEVKEKLNG